MIDLHTHSSASDGTLSPSELAAAAKARGLSAIALTDHDTTSGLDDFIKAGKELSLKVVPGVEIACSWYGFSLHLAALFIDHANADLQAMLNGIRQAREQRNQRILELLQSQGVSLSMEQIQAESKNDPKQVIGRPHFARALVKGEYCDSTRQAFSKFLGRNGSAYVPRFLPLPAEAIHTIHNAGGIAILAHPFGGIEGVPRNRTRQKLLRLIKLGLDGLEVYYCDHTDKQEKTARELARELQLLPSGGSDFHGANTPDVSLGKGYGNMVVPDDLLEPLRQRAEQRRRQR